MNGSDWRTYVIYGLFAVVMATGGFVMHTNAERISKLEREFDTVRAEQLSRTGRIASLESQQSDMAKRLERMEGKLDRLLERR